MDDANNIVDLEAERQRRIIALTRAGARFQQKIREAREHPLGLYKLCFADDNGEPIVLKWFHKEWADMILTHSHVMFEAPRGSSKTTFLVACILWHLGINPELRIKIICGNDPNAAKRLAEIRSHITQDVLYQQVFPKVKEDPKLVNNSQILNLQRKRHSRDSTIEAKGILSDGTGDRTDILVLDDICTRKNSVDEPSTRPKVLSKLRTDWLNTLNPRTGRVWSIFTPWHSEDANAVLKKSTKGRWAYRRYAHGKPGNPYHSIFPELFNEHRLRWIRLDIGAIEYAQAYLCKAMSSEIQVVRSKWLRIYNKLDVDKELLQRGSVILSVDPSGGKTGKSEQPRAKSDPDYYGFTVFLIDHLANGNKYRPKAPNRVYVVESYSARLTTAQACRHIMETSRKWQADCTVIEVQGAQNIQDWLYEMDPTLYWENFPATLSKRTRLESVTPWMQDYRERILFHPRTVQHEPKPHYIQIGGPQPAQVEAIRNLRSQLLDFPTTHDDTMDSYVQGLRYIRQCVLPLDNEDQELSPEERNAPTIDIDVKAISY